MHTSTINLSPPKQTVSCTWHRGSAAQARIPTQSPKTVTKRCAPPFAPPPNITDTQDTQELTTALKDRKRDRERRTERHRHNTHTHTTTLGYLSAHCFDLFPSPMRSQRVTSTPTSRPNTKPTKDIDWQLRNQWDTDRTTRHRLCTPLHLSHETSLSELLDVDPIDLLKRAQH